MWVSRISRLIPRRVRRLLRRTVHFPYLAAQYGYDFVRFVRHSRTFRGDSLPRLEAEITAHYHVLEKGLSMPEPTGGHGLEIARRLAALLRRYETAGYDGDRSQFQAARAALHAYCRFQDACGVDVAGMDPGEPAADAGGKRVVTRDGLAQSGPFDAFSSSRHSIRDFTDEPVDESVIEQAVALAGNAPSVCNRQASRVHAVYDAETIRRALAHQTGNRGFGHLAKVLLVVTADLQAFDGAKERNQAFIDGGLFAMNLLYALHFHRLGACPLNWSVCSGRDRRLRRVLGLPEEETVIMLIAVGHPPERFTVAKSARRPAAETYRRIG